MICAVSISETESKTQLSILCIYHIHIFFHPDFTVGLGISPNRALRLVGYTTGGETNPALKIAVQLLCTIALCSAFVKGLFYWIASTIVGVTMMCDKR